MAINPNSYFDRIILQDTNVVQVVKIRDNFVGKVKYVTIINPTDYNLFLYNPHVSTADAVTKVAGHEFAIGSHGDITLPLTDAINSGFLVIANISVAPTAILNATLIFTEENLNHNSANASGFASGGSNVNIASDSVGLAKEVQLPSLLDGGFLPVSIKKDSIGLVKSTDLPVLVSGRVPVVIGDDSYGLAKKDQLPTSLNSDGSLLVGTGRSTYIAGKIVVSVAGTAKIPVSTPCGDGVTFIASATNTGVVYIYPVGGNKTDVFPLTAGSAIFVPVKNLNVLMIDVSVSGESVYWNGAI